MRGERLSGVDAAWLRMDERTNLMMVTGFFALDRPIDLERLRGVVRDRLLQFDRFRQRVEVDALGRPHWVDDDCLDVNAHVTRGRLDPHDDDALRNQVGRLASTPLDGGRPLWHFDLLEPYRGGCAVAFRIHHCIGDGVALVRVLLSLCDGGGEPRRDGGGGPRVSAVRRVGAAARATIAAARDRGRARELVRTARRHVGSLAHLVLLRSDPRSALKGPLGRAKRVAWTEPVALAAVKDAAHARGATVNDVAVAAVAGALRRALQDRGDDPEGRELRAIVPVNLRPPDAPLRLGNRFGLVALPLPIGLEGAHSRLAEVRRRMQAIKRSPEAAVTFGLLSALGVVPSGAEHLGIHFFTRKATAVMTNVPGPETRVRLAGAGLDRIMFWAPRAGGLGVGVSVLSYAGELQIGLLTDAGLVPDPQTIAVALDAELRALVEWPRERPAPTLHPEPGHPT